MFPPATLRRTLEGGFFSKKSFLKLIKFLDTLSKSLHRDFHRFLLNLMGNQLQFDSF